MHHRFRPHAPVHGSRYRRVDVGIDPYRVHTMIRTPHEVGYKQEGRRPPPADGVGTAAFGFAGGCAICGWRYGRLGCFARCGGRVFRWLRPAGISRRARRDQRLCPWTPRFFEKNRVKLLSFYSRIVTCIWFAASCQGTLCPAPWLQKMESAGFSVSRSRSYPEAAATASPSGQTS